MLFGRKGRNHTFAVPALYSIANMAECIIAGRQGPKGDTGEQGPEGPQGIQGATGPNNLVFAYGYVAPSGYNPVYVDGKPVYMQIGTTPYSMYAKF